MKYLPRFDHLCRLNPERDTLHGIYNIKRINHSIVYSDGGIYTNAAEGKWAVGSLECVELRLINIII